MKVRGVEDMAEIIKIVEIGEERIVVVGKIKRNLDKSKR